ncbi:MAG: hypothetical protein HY017_19915 [Betaproteobacteria bacterium]|nr:hypothetical protein [Betaproteobacteria bacterium]
MKKNFFLSFALSLGVVGLVCVGVEALAQQTLEIVPLRNRPAEQVIPVLRPLLEEGGVISGQGFQLILRASPRNLRDLKSALAAIDAPQRQLQISVRFGDTGERSSVTFDARGSLRSGDATASSGPGASSRSSVEVRGTEFRSNLGERVDQRVQVLEGARAFITTGQTRPVHQNTISTGPMGTVISDNTAFQELSTGFEVVPRVSGERVLLDIQPRRDRSGTAGPASVDTQQVATTVSARLGEWIELGGSAENIARHERGVVSTSSASSAGERRVWLMVEELQR